jgi:mRNA-degrading endonuclease toxin of MazEF toxin-antitoxin module
MLENILRGYVYKVDLGQVKTPAIKGHEQGNQRLCVVLKYVSSSKLAVIVPITSEKPNKTYSHNYKLKAGVAGLHKDSHVLCHQIRSVSTERFPPDSYVGALDEEDFKKIIKTLEVFLGFNVK